MIFLFSATPALAFNPITYLINAYKAYVSPAPVVSPKVVVPEPIVTPPKAGSTGSLQANTTSPITIYNNNPSTITDTALTSALQRLLNNPDILSKLRGPQGPAGPSGPIGPSGASYSGGGSLAPAFIGVIQPNPATNFSGATLFSATNLSSNQFTTSTANITNLTVSGNTTLTGGLNVTGSTTLTALTAGTFNGLTITSSGGITNSTSINPLTTLAESWIGPSSTTGIYFKGGNVGVGTTSPNYKLDVNGNISSNEIRFNPRKPQPLVTFMFDDGYETTYTVMKPVFDAQGVVAVPAIVSNSIGTANHLTWAQLQELQNDGWEITSHTETHPDLRTLTEAQIRTELGNSKQTLENHGLTVNNFVYPSHYSNETVRRITREYYRSARGGPQGINSHVLNTYNLSSLQLDSTIRPTLATLEAYIDTATSENEWMIFYIHSTDSNDAATINTLIDYIKSKGVSIVTMNQALDLVGNVIDIGDSFGVGEKGVRLNFDGNVGIGTTGQTGKLDIQGLAVNDSPTLGAELLTGGSWTSTDWTGDEVTGWTHTTGNTTPLSYSATVTVGNLYQITVVRTGTQTGTATYTVGGAVAGNISATNGIFAHAPKALTTVGLVVTPASTFVGTITISIKQITAFSTPLVNLRSSDSTARIEIRANNIVGNQFIGLGAGRYNTTGTSNTANGMQSLLSNTTGSNNTANGDNSLFSNTTGTNNTANGYNSLYSNTTGSNNTANGMYSLNANTTGSSNTANGMQSLFANTTGIYNTANGMQSLFSNTTGTYNIANGYQSLFSNTTGTNNTANGYWSLFSNTTGTNNTANGVYALFSNTTGTYNIANGYQSLYSLRPTSKAITAFADYSGTVAGTVKATSVGHGLTGTSTKMISGTTDYNGSKSITVIDADSFYFTATWTSTQTGWWAIDSEGRYNTAEGVYAGRTLITGDSNTFLGFSAGFNVSQLNSASNSMALGNGAYTTASNQVVIGNTAITQTLLNGNVGIGTTAPDKKLEINLGTSSALRLTYNDADGSAANYADFTVSSIGSLTIAPTGTNPDISLTPGGTGSVILANTSISDATPTLSNAGFVTCSALTTVANVVTCTASDQTIKTNFQNFTNGLDFVRKIQPQTYSFKEGTGYFDNNRTRLGLIAQEVQTAGLGDAVLPIGNGLLQIDYNAITAATISAVKELDLNLNGISGTLTPLSGSSSESFVTTFFNNVYVKIGSWLADAGNGILRIFANEIDSNSSNTKNLCVSDDAGTKTCITKSQLDALLASPPSQGGVPASSGGGGNPATCSDGIQNQDETGVDTGGVCTPAVSVTLESIAITTPATKLSYTVGDTLDITGLAITGTYSDATTKVETIASSDVTGFDSSVAVTGQVLTVTVGEKTTTYTIDVI